MKIHFADNNLRLLEEYPKQASKLLKDPSSKNSRDKLDKSQSGSFYAFYYKNNTEALICKQQFISWPRKTKVVL